jgi:hypothetical protein
MALSRVNRLSQRIFTQFVYSQNQTTIIRRCASPNNRRSSIFVPASQSLQKVGLAMDVICTESLKEHKYMDIYVFMSV